LPKRNQAKYFIGLSLKGKRGTLPFFILFLSILLIFALKAVIA